MPELSITCLLIQSFRRRQRVMNYKSGVLQKLVNLTPPREDAPSTQELSTTCLMLVLADLP